MSPGIERKRASFDDKIEDFVCANEFEKRAFDFAREKHKFAKRKDGSEYFTHCVAVANLVREFGIVDSETIAATLCHDVVEDEHVSLEELEELFGPKVARWVDGLSKLTNKEGKSDELETRRKVVDRAFLEPQVAIIKLADRLHNMMTMDFMPLEKRTQKSQETLDIYAPLAESLGMWRVKTWLEDLSFAYVDPARYKWVKENLGSDGRLQESEVTNIHSYLEHLMEVSGFTGSVEIKYKGAYEADRKRERSARRGYGTYDSFGYVNDLVSYRVILDEKQESKKLEGDGVCYAFLGVVHEAFVGKIDVKRFDEFIVTPRVNNYRALQTTLNSESGPVEIAVVTRTMEEFNNWGVVKKLAENSADVREFVQKIVFLPSGKVRFLPKGATGWDIAFGVSPVLGEKAEYILVNGERKPLSYVVPNGAVVRVEYGKKAKSISEDTQKYVSPRTWELMSEQNNRHKLRGEVAKGKVVLKDALRPYGLISLDDLEEIDKTMESGNEWDFGGQPLITLLMETGCVSKEALYAQVGSGSQNVAQLTGILDRLGVSKEKLGWTTLMLKGVDKPGLLAELSGFIQEIGKNIVLVNNVSRANTFEMKIVISGMVLSEENELREFLSKNGNFGEVVLV